MLAADAEVRKGVTFSGPVFVVGVFRSGTSLLYALLNRHPQVALMYEFDVWHFPDTFSRLRFKRAWLQRQEFYNQALSRHRLISGGSMRGLENVRTPEDLYRVFSEGKAKTLWGEKSPFYCARLRQLVRRYPESRFILIWRDPIDIYRSVIRAGREERFFRRGGMLSRLIFYQEQMIQQVIELERAGARLCHVTYDGLVDDTEQTCRTICSFLEIEFDEKMLGLGDADLSAIYSGPEHDHLRHRRIERQQFDGEQPLLKPSVIRKLQRFDSRWKHLQVPWLGHQIHSGPGRGPSFGELLYHKIAGLCLNAMYNGKRMLFEFLPLAWLRNYRQVKNWFLARRPAVRLSLREQLSAHGLTILASYAILAFVVALDYLTGPDVTMAPFYLVPPAILTLVVGGRWGVFTAAIAVLFWTEIQGFQLNGSLVSGVLVWNCLMRFLVLLTVVLLLDRVRIEGVPTGK